MAAHIEVLNSKHFGAYSTVRRKEKGLHARLLARVSPRGKLTGSYSNWTPLVDRGVLFPEDIDTADPWQFKKFRVT